MRCFLHTANGIIGSFMFCRFVFLSFSLSQKAFSGFFLFHDILNWEYPLASILCVLLFVIGVWNFEFFFLPLGVAMALAVAPLAGYLSRRRKSRRGEVEEEHSSINHDDDDGKKRNVVEDSQVFDFTDYIIQI